MKSVVFLLVLIFIGFENLLAFTVGTYNLHNLENPDGLKVDIKNLEHVSVIGFQEVRFEDDKGDQLFSSILPEVFKYKVSQIVASDDNGHYEGHAIVSQYPIVRSQIIKLEHSGAKNREALAAWIKVNNQEIMVIDTDHEVDYASISFTDRKKQLNSIIEACKKMGFDGPQILLGDFNTSDSAANWWNGITGATEVELTNDLLIGAGWTPSFSETGDSYTFKSYGIQQQLDHIFVKNKKINGTLTWKRLHNRVGSDHYPIYISLDL